MDETPFFFNMPSNITIEHRGKKIVHINTQSQEKLKVSALLTFQDDGIKLEPYIIFKEKRNSPIVGKELNKYRLIAQNKIYYSFNENEWVTKEIINDWFKKFWFHYLSKFDFNFESILVLDHAVSHNDKDFMSL